jgi:DNA (cytosine-5)-methyltransferase 1
LRKKGIDVRLGIDIDPDCEYPYIANNDAEFLRQSVRDLSPSRLRNALRGAPYKLIAGCAPCQPFSTYSHGRTPEKDERWNLLEQFGRLVVDAGANLVTMENVPKLATERVFIDFVETLESRGFSVDYQVVDCSEYGLPQQRRRLVLLASRFGAIALRPPRPSARRSVRTAIGDLPPIPAGGRCGKDRLHTACALSELNLERMRQSKPGGSWRDWPEHLVARCHRVDSGRRYASVYGRMSWDDPSPTMTTQFYGFGSGRFGHPEQDRGLSLREGAMLQGFPRNYAFVRSFEVIRTKAVGRLIGNAVPVGLAAVIGASIMDHVKEHHARRES